jgi:FkbM family methyltransferase
VRDTVRISHEMSSSPCFLDPIIIPLIKGKTMLDVGCGYGRWGGLVHTNYWETVGGEPMEVDGLDAFEPNVALCTQKNVYRKVWHQQLPGTLSGSWDTVLACEVLEHLDQQDVEQVLDALERVATQRIICTSPNWPYFRGGGDTIVGFNEYEAHKAYVSRQRLVERGYTIIGAGFGNPEHPVVRAVHEMKGDWKMALELLPRLLPELAHTIVAYKDVSPAVAAAPEPVFITAPDGRSMLVPAGETQAAFRLQWNEIYGAVQHYDHPECAIARGDVVLDLGATFGIFALWALEMRGADVVVCVEPDPTNAMCVVTNLERYGFGARMAVMNRAAYSHDDGVAFQLVPASPEKHFVAAAFPEGADPAHQLQVPSVTVDSTVEQLGLEQVDCIKVDVVGCEVEAIAGATETIKRDKPRLIIAFHRPGHAERIQQLVTTLRPDYETKVVEQLLSSKLLLCW